MKCTNSLTKPFELARMDSWKPNAIHVENDQILPADYLPAGHDLD